MWLWPSRFSNLAAYQIHQVIELPVIRPEVTHWQLHQGECISCGKLQKASLAPDQTTGYGPRLTAFVGEMSGIVSVSRSAVQDLCASVFSIPLSKGAIQKMINRVSQALVSHYEAIGRVARAAPVNPTFPLLVQAAKCRFKGTTPDLRWITHREPLLACATP